VCVHPSLKSATGLSDTVISLLQVANPHAQLQQAYIQGGPKSKPHRNYLEVVLRPANEATFFEFECKKALVGIKYSVRDPICDAINYCA